MNLRYSAPSLVLCMIIEPTEDHVPSKRATCLRTRHGQSPTTRKETHSFKWVSQGFCVIIGLYSTQQLRLFVKLIHFFLKFKHISINNNSK